MARQLYQELKKREPFARLQQEVIVGLLRTGDLIQNRLGRLFREYGLTESQYNVLRILRGEGNPLPCLEIASRMIQVVPAITGLIDRLEKQEFVSRQRCTEDRRVIYIELTAKGRELLTQLDRPLEELEDAMVGQLSTAELKQLSRLLMKARQGAAFVDEASAGRPDS